MTFVYYLLAHLVKKSAAIASHDECFQNIEESFRTVIHTKVSYNKVLELAPNWRLPPLRLHQTLRDSLIVGHINIS